MYPQIQDLKEILSMNQAELKVQESIIKIVHDLYNIDQPTVSFQKTRKEFEGDITLVVFPFVKMARKKPEQVAEELGEQLKSKLDIVTGYNVVKGFLNICISDDYWMSFLKDSLKDKDFGKVAINDESEKIIVEYSSPNTNKPLHLGHIRNNLLGYSVAQIVEASGRDVFKVQVINDRGIHICKSMLAWQKFGNGETPESTGIKGDHLVGKYYVAFDKHYRSEMEQLVAEGMDKDEAKKKAPILVEAQAMLLKWENKDPDTIKLWETMNQWVYDGFTSTYDRMGVSFDKNYYESNTYILGKEHVLQGIDKGIFYRKEDGSVWCDLTDEGLDHKLVLRSDGTSVYITQDIGTAIERHQDFPFNKMVYTVGDEQDYHFKVLFIILKKLGYEWSEGCSHLSYGMVDLPSGKMKSREGTVVDADELMQKMNDEARAISEDRGQTEGMTEEFQESLYEMIGMSALKYFILKVDPRKRMMFDPNESIDLHGNTGPFIQYTYARISSILRKAEWNGEFDNITLEEPTKNVIKKLHEYPQVIQAAAVELSPALICNYTFELVKEYNHFYQCTPILRESDESLKNARIALSTKVAETIKSAMILLGIDVPSRM